MITATEARAKTDAARKTTETLLYSVKAMAEAGNNYATFNIDEIRDLEKSKNDLRELGFKLNMSGNFLTINW